MTERVQVGGLAVAAVLHRFLEEEALPGSGVEPAAFWKGADEIVHAMAPLNRALLARRDELQSALDAWHREHPGAPDPVEYEQVLRDLGYLVDEPEDFTIGTSDVDDEIAVQHGPQLVVPMLNARFATNAANARWGSLYDALYGTDAVPREGDLAPGDTYSTVRGAEVIRRGREVLDHAVPLAGASHHDVRRYALDADGLVAELTSGETVRAEPSVRTIGFSGDWTTPAAIVLRHHSLHVEIQIDPSDPVGATDVASVKDVVLEAAVTSIMDLEDSVAAVDADDKVLGYRHWLRLMQGTLTEEVTKGGETFTRRMHPDREYTGLDGKPVTLPGRALMLVRHVGHLMTTDAVLDAEGQEVPEGILDALVTTVCSLHDLRGDGPLRNSRAGSAYFVKPKMHGPDEVAFTHELFRQVELAFGVAPNTLKVGIMDEERRTSVNLKACIHAARDRVAFINTGFLDRTGDEIHTSVHAGPMARKGAMKAEPWIAAYETSNVDVGLACGLQGRAQIGKGMWAAPDNMADMLEQKVGHPEAGASCAWVPSPTAATLHATHYHRVDVEAVQTGLKGQRRSSLGDLLTIPLGDPSTWSPQDRQAELDNNVQGILGYVVRWVDAGVGCSKVPDIDGTPLMEDRATCRISSQHVAGWLLHGIVTPEQVDETFRRMAAVVDGQNAGDPDYRPMAPGFDGHAYLAARELATEGLAQPSGYTEPILHRRRRALKEGKSA